MSTFSCTECSEHHSLEFNLWLKHSYGIELESFKDALSDRFFMMMNSDEYGSALDPVFPKFVLPLMASKTNHDFDKICKDFNKMVQGFASYDRGERDRYERVRERGYHFTQPEKMIRSWKADILRAKFYVYKMMKLGNSICTKELSRLMTFENFEKVKEKRPQIMLDLKEEFAMHHYFLNCDGKPEDQWLEISAYKVIKFNLSSIEFPGNETYQFSVQVEECKKSTEDDSLNFHLKCCIRIGGQKRQLVEFDGNPLADEPMADWQLAVFCPKNYKMLFLAYQIDGFWYGDEDNKEKYRSVMTGKKIFSNA